MSGGRTETQRASILGALAAAWREHPHERLCQLVINATNPPNSDPFYVEDEELQIALFKYSQRRQVAESDD